MCGLPLHGLSRTSGCGLLCSWWLRQVDMSCRYWLWHQIWPTGAQFCCLAAVRTCDTECLGITLFHGYSADTTSGGES